MKKYNFRVAELYLQICFEENEKYGIKLLPSFMPFKIEKQVEDSQLLLNLTVSTELNKIQNSETHLIRDFDTGNGNTSVEKLKNGGYQFVIKNLNKQISCLLITNKNFTEAKCKLSGNYDTQCFGLNNALMMLFAFAGAYHQALLIHASLVRNNGYGYPFIAKSGTGKSTQVSMWLKYIKGCDLMNDDNPIIRIVNNKPFIYGSPWSGKTPCYRNVKAKLGAITRIDRAKNNSIEKLNPIEAFASFLSACSTMKWDVNLYDTTIKVITKIIETTPIFTLHCLPNKEAAEICYRTIAK